MGTLKEIENRYYKECDIVMLPTEDFTKIIKILSTGEIRLYQNDDHEYSSFKCVVKPNLQHQHLYITSDDEIKEGDWFTCGKKIYYNKIQLDGYIGLKKIIATTDKSLVTGRKIMPDGKIFDPNSDWDLKYGVKSGFGLQRIQRDELIPQPSQSFIKKYCEQGGIDKVLVEYYRNEESMMNNINTKGKKSSWLLKTDSHNNITIKSLKNSWSREELFKEIKTKYKCKNEIAFLNSFIKEL